MPYQIELAGPDEDRQHFLERYSAMFDQAQVPRRLVDKVMPALSQLFDVLPEREATFDTMVDFDGNQFRVWSIPIRMRRNRTRRP